MSDVAEKIRAIFDKHLVWDCFGYMAEMEKEVLAAVAELEQQITTLKFLVDTWEKPVIKHKELELRLSEIHQKMREQIIRLGMIRAGNIDQIWDAGWAYGLLHQLGKAPEFKTRKESFEWAKAKICRFQKREDSERMLLKDEQQKKD